ncbi:MAG: hypothetical protein GY765_35785 [bacterium]|nr:hypothetical protein [bacterium]
MSNNLFMFLYKTLLKRADNPGNSTYFLPNVLDRDSDGKPLLPISEKDWSLGTITGDQGLFLSSFFVQQWGFKLGHDKGSAFSDHHQVITCPDSPWVNLSFPTVNIDGLQNLYALDNPVVNGSPEGYTATISMVFNHYTTKDFKPKAGAKTLVVKDKPMITVYGEYCITQCLCTAPKAETNPTKCDNWDSTSVKGTGKMKFPVDNAWVDADITIRIDTSTGQRALKVDVTHLTLRGKKKGTTPTVHEDNMDLTLDSKIWIAQAMWLPKAKDAITSTSGQEGVFKKLNLALNTDGNLNSLSSTFTSQLNKALADALGDIPASGLPNDSGQKVQNQVDHFLFDWARYAVNNPQSQAYLPAFVYNMNNPQMEPYNMDKITIPDQTKDEMTFSNTVIADLDIVGLSNILAPAKTLVFSDEDISAKVNLSTMKPGPTVKVSGQDKQVPSPPLTAKGKFSMDINGSPLTNGTFELTIDTSKVSIVMAPKGPQLNQLQLNMQTLTLEVQPEAITVKIDLGTPFDPTINTVLNNDDNKREIVDALNTHVAGNMQAISSEASSKVQAAVAAKLGPGTAVVEGQ